MQKKNVKRKASEHPKLWGEVEASAAEAAYDENLVEALVLGTNGEVVADPALAAFDIDVLKDYKAGLSNIYKANAGDMDAMKSELLWEMVGTILCSFLRRMAKTFVLYRW